jgi:large subunit ribosomal protein L17
MRHRIFGKQLGRNHNQRQALLRSLVKNIFTYGAIETTDAKAKSVIPAVEKISSIIVSKPDLIARRELFKYLQDRFWVNNVFTVFKTTFAGQTSNFTKTIKIKRRQGDDALIVNLSFVKPIKFNTKKEVAKKVVETKKTIVKKAKVTKEIKK